MIRAQLWKIFMAKRTQPKDLIEQIVQDWQRSNESLDTSGTEIIGRIVRLSSLIGKKVDENLAQYDLVVGEFDVLAALLRADKHQLTPTQIQAVILISSGGLSNRINRLEKSGYIVRLPDPADRRGVIVELTAEGKALIEKIVPTHLAVENSLIESMSKADAASLQYLLRGLLIVLDQK